MVKKYLFVIFGPIVLAILNGYVSSYYFFSWGYDNRNQISTVLFGLSLIGSVFVVINNAKGSKEKIWFAAAGFMLAINLFIIYAIRALSNFGF
ncbi:MAG: hypothetical protein A2831_00395 [Candidatus Yanofskybacteria bacterium RIFCSPHIGHO2_01_FULL_44_17]|uniref:Uncharacterized protein n=1 Tax=Candidatus Yanofskybacteria bacterium RIFCSPHIGHO2_01_FULL_44_17 TaxID=1802668 RepID=A0A1F8F011_9BACT|nr:MAG: hypothetical protein A2831_00395 [Candidatus Yanofskybacteria bacterium RIFCSPHIGHO2_01_FULL_44_17]